MFVITVDLKEFSTGLLLILVFVFTTIKLLYNQNITIPNSIKDVAIPQMYIFYLLCDLASV